MDYALIRNAKLMMIGGSDKVSGELEEIFKESPGTPPKHHISIGGLHDKDLMGSGSHDTAFYFEGERNWMNVAFWDDASAALHGRKFKLIMIDRGSECWLYAYGEYQDDAWEYLASFIKKHLQPDGLFIASFQPYDSTPGTKAYPIPEKFFSALTPIIRKRLFYHTGIIKADGEYVNHEINVICSWENTDLSKLEWSIEFNYNDIANIMLNLDKIRRPTPEDREQKEAWSKTTKQIVEILFPE